MTGPSAAPPATALRRGITGYWLRIAVAAAVLGIVVLLGLSNTHPALLIAALVVGVGCVALPGSPAALVLIAVVALGVAADPFGAEVLLLVPLVHLLHVSCAHAALVPVAAHIHPAALRPALIRAAGIQVATFALIGVGAVVPAAPEDVVVVGLAAGSCLALGLLLVRLMWRT